MKKSGMFKWWEILVLCFFLGVVVGLAVAFDVSALTILNALFAIVGIFLLGKGLPIANFVMVVRCVLYVWMNAINLYWGEVICCVCISVPMYVMAIVSWMKKSSNSNVVIVNTSLKFKDYFFGLVLSVGLTVATFFVMRVFNTANLALSTISVFMGIFAAYLSIRRSAVNFAFYILDNLCLFVMWVMIIVQNGQLEYYVTLVQIVFALILNFYAIYNWHKMEKQQTYDKTFRMIMKVIKSE